jgi:hypothetical protein
MIIRKRVGGRVSSNHGDFADVDIIGIEGIEEGLYLDTMQIDCHDTHYSPEEFQRKFAIGMELEICTSTEITPWCADDSTDEEAETIPDVHPG